MYREIRPPLSLRRFVRCIWTYEADAPFDGMRVLPDGCVDSLYHREGADDAGTLGWVGTMRVAQTVTTSAPPLCVGVRFRPGGAAPFLGGPASDITDQDAALDDVWRDGGAIAEAAAHARTVDEIRDVLTSSLAARAARIGRFDAAMVRVAESIVARSGAARIEGIAEEIGLSGRQLHRRFESAVGVAPKALARIARFRAALDRARAAPDARWSEVAADAGYADQAHLTREFVALAGVPPTALRTAPT